MSGRDHGSYRSFTDRSRMLGSDDESERRKAVEDYRSRVEEARRPEALEARSAAPRARRNEAEVFRPELAKNRITRPSAEARRATVILVDNSGSNRQIAEKLRQSSAYFTSMLNLIDPQTEAAWQYFSDHCDGPKLFQYVDFVAPTAQGDAVMLSSLRNVEPAGGGDAPEAIECALWDACQIDFGHLEKKDRHLILVTDEVAHGMYGSGERDDGCPAQRSWRRSVELVGETFGSFEIVGCSTSSSVAKLQSQFLAPARLAYDFVDLSTIKNAEHRLGIIANALLFLFARRLGLQNLEVFLSSLYEKWLVEPIFGANTDLRAREAIRRFGKFLDAPPEKVEEMLQRVLSEG